MTIENHFKLNEKTSYTSLKTIEEKLEVMRNLQSHLPENTILKFHLFSICLVIGSFEFLAIGNLLDWSQYPQIILVGYIIIVFGLILWTYPFDYFTDVAIDEAINKPKKRYSELKGI